MKKYLGLLMVLAMFLVPAGAWADSTDASITTPDAGKKLDMGTVTSGAGTVYRQRIELTDATGTSGTLSAACADPTSCGANSTVGVALTGQRVATFKLSAGTLAGTIVPEISMSGSSGPWKQMKFLDENGVTQASLVTTNPNADTVLSIFAPTGATHARVRLSLLTSGSASGQMFATQSGNSTMMMGASSSGPKEVTIVSSAPAGNEPGPVVWVANGTAAGGSSHQDDTAYTVGTSFETVAAGIFKSSRDAVDDGDAGALAMTQNRALLTSIETPAGDTAMDDTLNAVKVVLEAVPAVGGQSAAAGVTSYTACSSQDTLAFASTTRQLMVALSSGELIRLCGMMLTSDADTNITFYEGTQTTNPCDTSSATLAGAIPLSSTNGRIMVWSYGGVQPMLRTKTAARQMCIGSSNAAANVTVSYVWARYP